MRSAPPTLDLLVRRLTEPFCGDPAMLDIAPLPEVTLSEDQVRTLALVLGEFSTNSNKYGALGHGGTIAIDGRRRRPIAEARWSEHSDRPGRRRSARGRHRGSTLIRRALAAQRGTLDVASVPTGST